LLQYKKRRSSAQLAKEQEHNKKSTTQQQNLGVIAITWDYPTLSCPGFTMNTFFVSTHPGWVHIWQAQAGSLEKSKADGQEKLVKFWQLVDIQTNQT
jgi:hypothetical protein